MNIQKNEPRGIDICDTNYFENVCAHCHLPSMTIWTNGHYCYNSRTLFE